MRPFAASTAAACWLLLTVGAPTNYGLHDRKKAHWAAQQTSLRFPKRHDTTYGCSYSYWSPEDYIGSAYSCMHHIPLLSCQKPTVSYGSGHVKTVITANKSDCIRSLCPNGELSSAAESNPLARHTVKQQTSLPIAAL